MLTAGAWPISTATPEAKVVLPPEIEAHIELFTKFYTERSTGRKLLWIHHLAYGILQSHFLDKRYEFSLSFYQMLMLLQVSYNTCLFSGTSLSEWESFSNTASIQFNAANQIKRSELFRLVNLGASDFHHLEALIKVRASVGGLLAFRRY